MKQGANGVNGGRVLVDSLLAQGVDRAFCVPGESFLAVLDALHDVQDRLQLVVCRQEGGAAIMAEAQGKLTGRPGVCFVTRGPGATNASTGVHTAFQDSTPMVLFIGQVARHMRHREAFQEVDLAAMFAPLAKWSAEISDPARIPEYVHRAFQTAMAGRPGPVVLALPEDVLSEVIASHPAPARRADPIPAAPRADQVQAMLAEIDRAQRPLLMLGGGGWSAQAGRDALAFARARDLPLTASLRCQDYVDNEDPNYVGHFTVGADPWLARRLAESDLLVALGPRLGEMTTGGYRLLVPPHPGKRLIHVHPDPEELGRVYQADLPVNASPAEVLALLAQQPARPSPARAEWTAAIRAEFEDSRKPLPTEAALDLGKTVVHLADRLPEDTIVCTGAGNYTGWIHRHWPFRSFRTQLAPTSGAMGYSVPAAISAALAHPGRTVLSVSGDGCFQMHPQELATAKQYGAKVLFLVVNNGIYGTIRMHQEREYPGRISGTDMVNPDFAAFARAYGFHAERVDRTEDFAPALDRALEAPGSALIELVTDPDVITARTTLTAIRAAALARG